LGISDPAFAVVHAVPSGLLGFNALKAAHATTFKLRPQPALSFYTGFRPVQRLMKTPPEHINNVLDLADTEKKRRAEKYRCTNPNHAK
jgi:hypothetical protein